MDLTDPKDSDSELIDDIINQSPLKSFLSEEKDYLQEIIDEYSEDFDEYLD